MYYRQKNKKTDDEPKKPKVENNKNIKNLGMFESVQESMDSFNPYNQLNDKEFDVIINKIATLLFLVSNKNINPTNLFLNIMGDVNFQKLLIEITSCQSLILILRTLLNRYPNLIKSKMLRNNAIKINKKLKKKNINVH